jgi:hypothetical protein
MVKSIDLSHNLVAQVKNLQSCWKLEYLNLSHNRIADIANINQAVGNLKKLNLSNNSIVNIEGLEKLYSLESLNLSHNKVAEFSEVELLSKLPLLTKLKLIGNPVASLDNYRTMTLKLFAHQPRDVCQRRIALDNSITQSHVHTANQYLVQLILDKMELSQYERDMLREVRTEALSYAPGLIPIPLPSEREAPIVERRTKMKYKKKKKVGAARESEAEREMAAWLGSYGMRSRISH